MKKVLVVAVHPDDETLGCGGTILWHKERGDSLHWLILSCPTESYGFPEAVQISQKKTVERVASAYGFDSVTHLDFPATGLAEVSECNLVKAISGVMADIQPNIIYLPFHGDVHGDHKVAFNAVYSCTKPFRYPSVEKVLMVETLSETDQAVSNPAQTFSPNVFVDISKQMDRKLEILSLYESEIQPPPFPRSLDAIRSLGCVRGAAIYSFYAEAFMLLREIIR